MCGLKAAGYQSRCAAEGCCSVRPFGKQLPSMVGVKKTNSHSKVRRVPAHSDTIMPSDALPDDLETLKAMLLAEQCESERLRQIITAAPIWPQGRDAARISDVGGLEDAEQTAASDAAADQLPLTEPRGTRSDAAIACFRSICLGSRSSSISTAGPAPAARANCTGLGKTIASGWTSCRRSSGVLVTRRPK